MSFALTWSHSFRGIAPGVDDFACDFNAFGLRRRVQTLARCNLLGRQLRTTAGFSAGFASVMGGTPLTGALISAAERPL